MYLNTPKRIKDTLINGTTAINMVVSKFRVLYTPDIDLVGGTPEYKLNLGFYTHKLHTFSCTGGGL